MLKPKSAFRTQEEYLKYLTSEIKAVNFKLRQQIQYGLCKGDLDDDIHYLKLLIESTEGEIKSITCSPPDIKKEAEWTNPTCINFYLVPLWEQILCIPEIIVQYASEWDEMLCMQLKYAFKSIWEEVICLGDISNLTVTWSEAVCSVLNYDFASTWVKKVCVEDPILKFNVYWDKDTYICVFPGVN